jgi:hypothetical protein
VNGDGVIDLRDVAMMQNCFTGDGVTECGTGCRVLDFTGHDDIDLSDFYYATRRLTGPLTPYILQPGGRRLTGP